MVTKYREKAPKLAEWMEGNLPEGLAVFDPKLGLSETARKRLRTTNGLERVNKELKRRTRVATLFPNEASLLRLVSALPFERSCASSSSTLRLDPPVKDWPAAINHFVIVFAGRI